jgi:hypothetical protein
VSSGASLNSDGPRVVAGRACGSCMMCCKVPDIPEFKKPSGVWCPHAVIGKGCGIYSTRPRPCQTFYCLWMLDRTLGPEWKPERAKFVLYVQQNNVHLQIAVDPAFPNAWSRAPFYAHIKRWAREGAEHGRFVFVRVGKRTIVVFPDRDTEVDNVDPEAGVMITRRLGPTGFNYSIEVTPRQIDKTGRPQQLG